MKRALQAVIVCAAMFAVSGASAQTYIKLNGLYALVGVINPQAEFTLSPHSTISIDATYSPWKSVKGKHFHFGILQNEYRYYFKQSANGWYVSGNIGATAFDINKPRMFKNGLISFNGSYGKGFGIMVGAGAGYQHVFRERWVVDVFVAIDWMGSWYNGYSMDGEINMYPNGHEGYAHPDPFNASGETLPSKIGVSIGYRIFSPDHKKSRQ